MKRETLQQFVARGGRIEIVHYRAFEDIDKIPTVGMRDLIQNGRQLAHRARQAGIASGVARRRQAGLSS